MKIHERIDTVLDVIDQMEKNTSSPSSDQIYQGLYEELRMLENLSHVIPDTTEIEDLPVDNQLDLLHASVQHASYHTFYRAEDRENSTQGDGTSAQGIEENAGFEDPVNHPSHYTSHPSGVECIEITRHMSFNLGNAFKYIWRADLKGKSIEDLEKAEFYIRDEINKRKREQHGA